MAKTRRMIEENLKLVDVVVELVDARMPLSSRNPDFDRLFATRPRIVALNKADLADPAATQRWVEHFRSMGISALAISASDKNAVKRVITEVDAITRERREQQKARGINKTVRAMVAGIPNVGKSTFINSLKGRSSAKASDRPGVTRGKQWIIISTYLEFLDTPGLLWPKFDDKLAARRLAYIGSVRDEIMDMETLAGGLLADMAAVAPGAVKERYHITELEGEGDVLLERACRGRGWLLSGGRFDTERGARVVLDEFRAGKLGRITLELPRAEGRSDGTAQ